jgi:hypothetical protein
METESNKDGLKLRWKRLVVNNVHTGLQTGVGEGSRSEFKSNRDGWPG